jgi:uncharacterized membrane protein YhhN
MEGMLSPSLVATLVTCLGVAAMFVADHTGKRLLEFIGKPAAALAFLGLGFTTAAGHESPITHAFLAALALSLVGDVCLMLKTDASFLAGLGAFLLGHVGFAAAFALRGVDPLWCSVMLLPTLAFAFVVWRWLSPHVPAPMKIPVIAYTSVISSMLVLAIGTHGARPAPFLVLAAMSFVVSDLAVAREKFVTPTHTNRYWGLPLYFGAQLVFAAHLLD